MEISCLRNILYSIDINYVSDNSSENGKYKFKNCTMKKTFLYFTSFLLQNHYVFNFINFIA